MSDASYPVVADWRKEDIDYVWTWQPTEKARTISAGQDLKVFSSQEHKPFSEGVLEIFSGTFDSPLCGVRVESNNNYDTGHVHTVQNVAVAFGLHEDLFARIPPTIPYGLYMVTRDWPFYFREWVNLYLFNGDTEDHTIIGFGFSLVLAPREKHI